LNSIGQEAGDAFSKAANMQIQLNERDEAASTFINAAKCYKKTNFEGMICLFIYLIFNYLI
jgi:alpha-soluble NSF attachment protein